MNEIILLVDYRDCFYSSHKLQYYTMDIDKIVSYFHKLNYKIRIVHFPEIDFIKFNYKDCIVLYTSSEDPGLRYKDYIEDIILGLQINGAILIPDFYYFRAHHNKIFMEILRKIYLKNSSSHFNSQIFGTFEDYLKFFKFSNKEYIVKIPNSAGSREVFLIKDCVNANNFIRKISFTLDSNKTIYDTILNYFISKNIFIIRNIKSKFLKILSLKTNVFKKQMSRNRNKFLIQDFVTQIDYDYKVLIYYDKYYVLRRDNRTNDFRASGSGNFIWPENVPDELLSYCEKVFKSFNVPFISIDVAFHNSEFYLFEFQFMFFGNLTMEGSNFFFQKSNGNWSLSEEKPDLEKTFCYSVDMFLRNNLKILS